MGFVRYPTGMGPAHLGHHPTLTPHANHSSILIASVGRPALWHPYRCAQADRLFALGGRAGGQYFALSDTGRSQQRRWCARRGPCLRVRARIYIPGSYLECPRSFRSWRTGSCPPCLTRLPRPGSCLCGGIPCHPRQAAAGSWCSWCLSGTCPPAPPVGARGGVPCVASSSSRLEQQPCDRCNPEQAGAAFFWSEASVCLQEHLWWFFFFPPTFPQGGSGRVMA